MPPYTGQSYWPPQPSTALYSCAVSESLLHLADHLLGTSRVMSIGMETSQGYDNLTAGV